MRASRGERGDAACADSGAYEAGLSGDRLDGGAAAAGDDRPPAEGGTACSENGKAPGAWRRSRWSA
ncbi:hypothetical protein GCM10009834_15510 [Streptomonospora arabica]|uniref:Uncharacterized protein n=1 Tax=Streptomonospora halophila TaxID=427369 RepID=A0ABP9GY26_9ACTN